MSDADRLRELVVLDEIVPAGKLWGHAVRQGEILRLVDLEGQQAVDFLCFDAADPTATAAPIRSKFKATSISATALYFTRIAALRCLRSSPIPAVATTRFTAAVVKRTIFCGTEYAIRQAVTRTSARSWLASNWTNARSSAMSTSSCRCRSSRTGVLGSPAGSRNPAAMSSCEPSAMCSPSCPTVRNRATRAMATTRHQSG